MTISSSTNKSGPYNGNGAATVFARTFRVLEANHLKVYQTVGGVTSEVTTGITKDNIGSDSGNVTFSTAPATGTQITLLREIPLIQETDYSAQGKVSPTQVEDDLDRQEMQIQDQAEQVHRSYKAPLTGKSFTDGNVPAFDAAGDIVDSGTSVEEVSSNASASAASASAAGASASAAEVSASAASAYADAAAASASAVEASALYGSRSEAEAAVIEPVVVSITFLHEGLPLSLVRDESGTALTTSDGQTWSPSGNCYLGHWGVTGVEIGPGTYMATPDTDEAATIQAAMDWCLTRGRDLRGAETRVYGVSSQIVWGAHSGVTPAGKPTLRNANIVWIGSGDTATIKDIQDLDSATYNDPALIVGNATGGTGKYPVGVDDVRVDGRRLKNPVQFVGVSGRSDCRIVVERGVDYQARFGNRTDSGSCTGSEIHVDAIEFDYLENGDGTYSGDDTITRTIDPATAVDTATDTITDIAHGMTDGYAVQYQHGGGTAVGGLTSYGQYFLVNVTADTYQLAATEGGAAIDLTSVGAGSAHKIKQWGTGHYGRNGRTSLGVVNDSSDVKITGTSARSMRAFVLGWGYNASVNGMHNWIGPDRGIGLVAMTITAAAHRYNVRGGKVEDGALHVYSDHGSITDMDLTQYPHGALKLWTSTANNTFPRLILTGIQTNEDNPAVELGVVGGGSWDGFKGVFHGCMQSNGAPMTLQGRQVIDGQYTDPGVAVYDSFASFVFDTQSNRRSYPDRHVIRVGSLLWMAESGATAISALPGFVPLGTPTPDHFAENADPGTTDMKAAIQGAIDYAVSEAGAALGYFSKPAPVVAFRNEKYYSSGTISAQSDARDLMLVPNGCLITTDFDGPLFSFGDNGVFAPDGGGLFPATFEDDSTYWTAMIGGTPSERSVAGTAHLTYHDDAVEGRVARINPAATSWQFVSPRGTILAPDTTRRYRSTVRYRYVGGTGAPPSDMIYYAFRRLDAAGDLFGQVTKYLSFTAGDGAWQVDSFETDITPDWVFTAPFMTKVDSVQWDGVIEISEYRIEDVTSAEPYANDAAGTVATYGIDMRGFKLKNTNLTATSSVAIRLGLCWNVVVSDNTFYDFWLDIDSHGTGHAHIENNYGYMRNRTPTKKAFFRQQGVFASDDNKIDGTGIHFNGNEVSGDPSDPTAQEHFILIKCVDGFYYAGNHAQHIKHFLTVDPEGSANNYKNNRTFDIISGGNNYADNPGGNQVMLIGTVAYTGAGGRQSGLYKNIKLHPTDWIRGAGTATHGAVVNVADGGGYAAQHGGLTGFDLGASYDQHDAPISVLGDNSGQLECIALGIRGARASRARYGSAGGPGFGYIEAKSVIVTGCVAERETNAPDQLFTFILSDADAGEGTAVTMTGNDFSESTYGKLYNLTSPVGASVNIYNNTPPAGAGRIIKDTFRILGGQGEAALPWSYMIPATETGVNVSVRALGQSHPSEGLQDRTTGAQYSATFYKDASRATSVIGTTEHYVHSNVGPLFNSAPVRAILMTGAAWPTSTAVAAGDVYVSGGNVFLIVASGTTGASAPVHTNGFASTGSESSVFVGPEDADAIQVVLAGSTSTKMYWVGEVEILQAR